MRVQWGWEIFVVAAVACFFAMVPTWVIVACVAVLVVTAACALVMPERPGEGEEL